jgi:hypothetical protein
LTGGDEVNAATMREPASVKPRTKVPTGLTGSAGPHKRFRFRLRIGSYVMADPSGAKAQDNSGRPADFTVWPPAVIETDVDLEARFGSQKFQRIHDDDGTVPGRFVYDPARETIDEFIARVKAGSDDGAEGEPAQVEPSPDETTKLLETMTVKELQGMAEDSEIDLKGATRKEDIIRVIKSSNVKVI